MRGSRSNMRSLKFELANTLVPSILVHLTLNYVVRQNVETFPKNLKKKIVKKKKESFGQNSQ
jgi:hypothetical protein